MLKSNNQALNKLRYDFIKLTEGWTIRTASRKGGSFVLLELRKKERVRFYTSEIPNSRK